jgi:polyisoprenoid-binding protein YceI
MKKLLLTTMMLTLSLLANTPAPKNGCILSQEGEVTVGWEAYKTFAKKGVRGLFGKTTYQAAKKEGKNFKEILVGSQLTIDTQSVNTKNAARDKTLVMHFFNLLTNHTIHAKIIDIHAKSKEMGKPKTGTIMIEITMNDITKNIPMNYTYTKGVMQAIGYIDILDFQGSKALASINKACFDLHQGKTWSDVTINFTMHIKADLCHVPIKK